MGRPKKFDQAAALDGAMRCFWALGYEATSVRNLAHQMGIRGASLYNSFGDKRALYRRALEHYVEQSFRDRVDRFEGHLPPRDAIVAFFDEVVERSLGDTQRKGCMLVNAALELAPHDGDFQAVVAAVLTDVEAFFRRCVAAGQQAGTISGSQSAEALGQHLLAVLLGIRVLARSRPERVVLRGIVDSTIAMLDGRPA